MIRLTWMNRDKLLVQEPVYFFLRYPYQHPLLNQPTMKTLMMKPVQAVWICGMALFFNSCSQEKKTTEQSTQTTIETSTPDTATASSQAHRQAGGMKGMMGHMHRNMEQMQGMRMQMTGDPDHDFAQMMVMHHQGAIRMAEEEVANGTDSQLKEIAKKTMASNQADIEKLQSFLKTHQAPSGDTAATMRMMHTMRGRMAGMHQKGMDMNQDTDQSFAQMMIHHHQSGIAMSEEFLKQGKTQTLKTIARNMMEAQQKEIKELEAWQQTHKR